MRADAVRIAKALGTLRPLTAIILGSGLGDLTGELERPVEISYADLESFPKTTVSGHGGKLVGGIFMGRPVLMLAGRAHYYEQGNAGAMRPVLETLQDLGIKTLILTNAAGAIDLEMVPGSLMLIEDHINFAGINPLFGEPSDARFVGRTQAYDRDLQQAFLKAAASAKEQLHRGIYMWFSGPSFETPAEIRMARILGAQAIGMSTVPEVILARFFNMRVAAISVITNHAAGLNPTVTDDPQTGEISHQETKQMAPIGGARLGRILRELFRSPDLDL